MTHPTDRELLALAAKAAGTEIKWELLGDSYAPFTLRGILWSPLTDDGDALRLAVKLNLIVEAGQCWVVEAGQCWIDKRGPMFGEDVLPCPYAATRRAIVRAAAEIGRSMK